MSLPVRKSVKLSLNIDLVTQARDLGIDLSRAAEEGIQRAVKAEKESLWLIENVDAIAECNRYIEKHGLSLAKYRLF